MSAASKEIGKRRKLHHLLPWDHLKPSPSSRSSASPQLGAGLLSATSQKQQLGAKESIPGIAAAESRGESPTGDVCSLRGKPKVFQCVGKRHVTAARNRRAAQRGGGAQPSRGLAGRWEGEEVAAFQPPLPTSLLGRDQPPSQLLQHVPLAHAEASLSKDRGGSRRDGGKGHVWGSCRWIPVQKCLMSIFQEGQTAPGRTSCVFPSDSSSSSIHPSPVFLI